MNTSRKHLEDLIERVKGVIDRHDPFCLRRMGAPEDELEPLARRIAYRLSRCSDEEHCLTLVFEVLTDAFGDATAPREAFVAMAQEIWVAVGGSVDGRCPLAGSGDDY